MAVKTLAFRVTGLVQGVWFRGWTQREAQQRGLSGWVRNNADGTVSGVLSGPDGAVADMVAALGQGPQQARVDRVETRETDAPPDPGFQVRH